MNASEQIAAINRKRADEHRRVDMQHDQLIQQVRERCAHYSVIAHKGDDDFCCECAYCGQLMPGSE